MDYLTWLMALQEPDSRESLPELAAFVKAAGTASSAAAELAEQWESVAAAAEKVQKHSLGQEPAASRNGKTGTVKNLPCVAFSYGSSHGETFSQLSGETDMEAISRFFERDARRF